jgi:hypothetical protein
MHDFALEIFPRARGLDDDVYIYTEDITYIVHVAFSFEFEFVLVHDQLIAIDSTSTSDLDNIRSRYISMQMGTCTAAEFEILGLADVYIRA